MGSMDGVRRERVHADAALDVVGVCRYLAVMPPSTGIVTPVT